MRLRPLLARDRVPPAAHLLEVQPLPGLRPEVRDAVLARKPHEAFGAEQRVEERHVAAVAVASLPATRRRHGGVLGALSQRSGDRGEERKVGDEARELGWVERRTARVDKGADAETLCGRRLLAGPAVAVAVAVAMVVRRVGAARVGAVGGVAVLVRLGVIVRLPVAVLVRLGVAVLVPILGGGGGGGGGPPPAGCATDVIDASLEVHVLLKGLIDLSREVARLQKEAAAVEGRLAKLQAKMAMPEYATKCKPQQQQEDAAKAQGCEGELAAIGRAIAQFEAAA
mmetsp:Transcript_4900/g.14710  ORF Transcript_4900/g.14710 Transcript_4900/m.14710 type:complete len:284 (+) Transcript_4900:344-1195(+)